MPATRRTAISGANVVIRGAFAAGIYIPLTFLMGGAEWLGYLSAFRLGGLIGELTAVTIIARSGGSVLVLLCVLFVQYQPLIKVSHAALLWIETSATAIGVVAISVAFMGDARLLPHVVAFALTLSQWALAITAAAALQRVFDRTPELETSFVVAIAFLLLCIMIPFVRGYRTAYRNIASQFTSLPQVTTQASEKPLPALLIAGNRIYCVERFGESLRLRVVEWPAVMRIEKKQN